MKKTLFLLVCTAFLWSCGKEKKVNSEVLDIPVEAEIIRFDQEFFNSTASNFKALQHKYPYLLSNHVDDSVWLKKKSDTLFVDLYNETQKKFADLSDLEAEFTNLFKHIKYYFPNENPKKVLTVLSEVDINSRAIYADTLSIVSLDTYLGKDHRFYVDFDTYILGDFEPERITVDLAENFASQKIAQPNDRTFLSQMIYWGKITYLKEMLLPEKAENLIVNYTPEQLQWAKTNEAQVWRYFIENKYLYNNDIKLVARFIQRAPFSKFYLELDPESPGSIGVYTGWQIVRAYMKNNNVTLQELVLKDAKTIFEESKYKPKK